MLQRRTERSDVLWYRTRLCVYTLLLVLQVVAGVSLAVLGAAARIPDAGPSHDWWRHELDGVWGSVVWVREAAPYATAPLALLIGAAAIARQIIGPPWTWAAIKKMLCRWQETAMEGRLGNPHEHRITLFKARRFGRWFIVWPWSRILVPVLRSGEFTQRTSIYFRIPDEADKCTGVAGMAYVKGEEVSVHGLPDVSNTPSEAELADYAERARISVKDLKRRRPHARSLFAMPLEVNGKPWGMVVLDSRSGDELCKGTIRKTEAASYLLGLTILLQRRAS